MRISFILFTTLFSQLVFAQNSDLKSNLFTKRISPCESWTYNSDVRAYVCRSNPWSVEVVEARELVRVLNDMQRKLNDLERRVQILESNR